MGANTEGTANANESGVAYETHPAWLRLEEQRKWYDDKSRAKQFAYKGIKFAQMVVAAAIPLVALVEHPASRWVAAACGATIAILESVQQLGQYQFLWITYRSTAEHLKHDRALFLSAAGPYRALPMEERLVLLAERVSSEHANWFDESNKSGSRDKEKPPI